MNQNERILRHLKDYGSITQSEATAEYGCQRLAARIKDLRDVGYVIETTRESGRNRYGERTHYARYSLK